MKFAHEFKEALHSDHFPAHWVDNAVHYGELKKCLKRIVGQLHAIGLKPEVLHELLERDRLRYTLGSDGDNRLKPKLTVVISVRNGVPVDATLSRASRGFLEELAAKDSEHLPRISPMDAESSTEEEVGEPLEQAASSSVGIKRGAEQAEGVLDYVELPLVFDEQFFDILRTEVASLEALQVHEENVLTKEIDNLGKEVSALVKPSRIHKSDLNRWRSIFEIYITAEVFFATQETVHGQRSAANALEKLQWFEGEVMRQELVGKFKLKESSDAFGRFVRMNTTLVTGMRFQEINQIAVAKILKKFDKRTAFGVSKTFPNAIGSSPFLTRSIATDMCAQLSKELLSTVPRMDDYLCPICTGLAYMPVRLNCGHLFCIRCVVKLQRTKVRCPLCRENTLGQADGNNLDGSLEKFMWKYFHKEAKEKQRANDTDRGKEMFGPEYEPPNCVIL